ncbi:MAG: hypothetical protein U1E02_06145, partial [Hydrogenophaga sp.]|nr:hypothetical protein [Hydrogenophaga sp.]
TEDTILLVVQDSCWLQELYLLSPVLLKTINKTLDAPRIKNLRFRVASSAVKKEKKRNLEIKKQPLKKVCLNPTEEAALKKIGDQELTHALRQFLVRCYQER